MKARELRWTIEILEKYYPDDVTFTLKDLKRYYNELKEQHEAKNREAMKGNQIEIDLD